MVGYAEDCKTYRVYDPMKRKCYVRRDVVFNEEPDQLSVIIQQSDQREEINDDEDDVFYGSKGDNVLDVEKKPYRINSKSSSRNSRKPIERDLYPL